MTPQWLLDLRPAVPQSLPGDAVLPARAGDLAARVGDGPAGWAVELGAKMASRITAQVPELALEVIAVEVRKGCEAAAIGGLSALAADGDAGLVTTPEVLAGPIEMVARGIGIEHMLRSIHIAHATATATVLDVAQQLIPESERFTTMRRVSEFLFAVVDELTERMAREYGRAHQAWLTTATALRMEVVEEILRGAAVSIQRATRVLGYDLTRQHLAVIAFTDTTTSAELAHLHAAAATILSEAQCAATLILPVGAQQVWAWGSRPTQLPELPAVTSACPDKGIKVAVGLAGGGVEGFRRSHEQAAHAARIGANTGGARWLFDYQDVDVVAMLSTDMDAAHEFVTRELGGLAGAGEPATNLRRTLKCYLDRDRSLAGTAQELHIARNTVAYRVQRAEQLRGRPISERRMQLHAALALVDELGQALLPSDGP